MKHILLPLFLLVSCFMFGQHSLSGRYQILPTSDADFLAFDFVLVNENQIIFTKDDAQIEQFEIIQHTTDSAITLKKITRSSEGSSSPSRNLIYHVRFSSENDIYHLNISLEEHKSTNQIQLKKL